MYGQSLIDDIINSVNNFVYQGVGSLETGLLSTPPEKLGFRAVRIPGANGVEEVDYPEAKREIEEGLHKLETLLNSTVDKNFDKFEIYVLRNILSVPAELINWVRLSHYEVGERARNHSREVLLTRENITYPAAENAHTAESVQLLRRKLAASRTVSRSLLEQHNRNEALLGQLRGIVGETQNSPNALSFLTNSASAQCLNVSQQPDSRSLTTNTNFAVSQIPALKALVEELRPKLATLRSSTIGMTIDTAKDELREERRGYIELRTRSHLERSGQSLEDHSTILSGKRVDPEEVQALEQVATTFDPA